MKSEGLLFLSPWVATIHKNSGYDQAYTAWHSSDSSCHWVLSNVDGAATCLRMVVEQTKPLWPPALWIILENLSKVHFFW